MLEAVGGLDIDNVRELLGALNRLVAFQAVSDKPIDAEQARALRRRARWPRPPTSRAVRRLRSAAGDRRHAGRTSSPTSSPRSPPRWRSRSTRGAPRSPPRSCAGKARATAPAGSKRCWSRRSPPIPSRRCGSSSADVAAAPRRCEAEAAELAPDLAGSAAFRDPERHRRGGSAARSGPGKARAAARARRRSGSSTIWSKAPGNRMALEARPGRRGRSRRLATTRWSSSAPAGSGKTHLLHAIGQRARGPRARRRSPASARQEFTGELIEAIDRDAVGIWRARYRRVGAFLLDDVHLIAEKDRTQDELFLLFNLLLEVGPPDGLHLRRAAGGARRGGAAAAHPARGRPGRRAAARPIARCAQRWCSRELRGRELGAADAGAGGPSGRAAGGLDPRGARRCSSGCCNAAEARNVAPSRGARPRGAGRRAPAAGRAPRRAGPAARGQRSSGIVAPTAGGARSREKMVWEWPELGRPPARGVALMAIKGSLKEASLPDVIQLLFLGRRTGCLALADRHNFGTIYFDEGQIVYASIVNRRDRLGDILLRSGRITAEQLRQAVIARRTSATTSWARSWWSSGIAPREELERLHPAPDRGGGVLPVHLDLGHLQLRGRRPAGARGLPGPDQSRSTCCSRARAGWTSGA